MQKRARDADAIDLTEDASPREKKMRESINDAAKEFVCPITHELPNEPVTAEDGKIYERDAILEWFRKKDGDVISPSTGEVIGTKLLPAVQVRNTIESLIQTGAIEGELAEAWQKASEKKLEFEKRVKEMRAKAEGGDGDAMHWMGVCYTFGQGVAKDEAQARAWYERSAAARNPKGLASFSNCLLTGAGGPQDFALGLLNMTEAAYLGSDMGAAVLGESFFNGMCGLPKDPVRARFWLKKVVDGECEVKHICPTCMPNVTRMLAALDAAPAE
jgi:TPR repeat protein